MKLRALLLLSLTMTTPVFADAVAEVRAAESAFAKAFADRDKAKFFSFVADDAVFVPAPMTLRGKQQIIERWSRFFDNVPVAPFSWGPERVEVTNDGKTGFSMGPIYDPNGQHAGYYSSIWQKQADGSWKIIVDGPGYPAPPFAEDAIKVEEGHVAADDGTKLYYRRMGRGPVVVIAPLDFIFHAQLRQFADIATIVTYDMRGRGRSEQPKDPASISIVQDVNDLEAVRRELKIDKFIPLGYSYLGKMVAMYAAAYPDRVARMIQLSPLSNESMARPPDDSQPPQADVDRLKQLTAENAIETKPREYCEAMWNVYRYAFVGDPAHASRFDVAGTCALENEWPVNFNRTMTQMLKSPKSVLSADELKKISMPVLIIHGTKDRTAAYDGGRAWAASLPNARLVSVEGAAHNAWLDDPVTVFGAIRHFLRGGEWPLGSTKP